MGRVEWDVLNEPLGKTDVRMKLGDAANYAREAHWFKLAKKRFPRAKRIINENRIISDPNTRQDISARVRAFKARIQTILEQGGAVNAIGFQSRFSTMNTPEQIWNRLQYFADFGFPLLATEFEIKDDHIRDEFDRARMTERVMTLYFSHPQVTDISIFTFMRDFNRTDSRHLIDTQGQPNLRGKIWLYLVKKHWVLTLIQSWERPASTGLPGTKAHIGLP